MHRWVFACFYGRACACVCANMLARAKVQWLTAQPKRTQSSPCRLNSRASATTVSTSKFHSLLVVSSCLKLRSNNRRNFKPSQVKPCRTRARGYVINIRNCAGSCNNLVPRIIQVSTQKVFFECLYWFQDWAHLSPESTVCVLSHSHCSLNNYFSISVQFVSDVARVSGLHISNCVGSCNNWVPRDTKVSATDMTQKVFFERLY